MALALLAFAGADELGVYGFISAFVGGLAFGTAFATRERDSVLQFDAGMGSLLSLIVWFMFGAFLVQVLDGVTGESALFAVLALTVVRMVPVALLLVRSGLDRSTVAFIGWFGPRGLASVVFALVVSDALSGDAAPTSPPGPSRVAPRGPTGSLAACLSNTASSVLSRPTPTRRSTTSSAGGCSGPCRAVSTCSAPAPVNGATG